MYKKFLTDSWYLTLLRLKSALCFGALSIFLFSIMSPKLPPLSILVPGIFLFSSVNVLAVSAGFLIFAGYSISLYNFNSIDALAIFLSLPWTIFATAVLHNAAHGSIKPKFLNRILGELFGFFQLAGFPEWVISHNMHHSFPDDPKKDPHPPVGLSYFDFLLGMRKSVVKVMLNSYFERFGSNVQNRKKIVLLALISKIDHTLKICCWWLLLGPRYFAFFFCFSIVLKMYHYAWFNWATHKKIDGENVTLNLNHGLYRLVNTISFGLYYHKNHHTFPMAFDPRRVGAARTNGETIEKAA